MRTFSIFLLSGITAFFISCTNQNVQDQRHDQENESKVFLNYTEAGLDSAYNQVFWAPNYRLVFAQLDGMIALADSAIGKPERISYGDSESETLDLYRPEHDKAPVHIYIHGGAWRGGNGSGLSAYDARKFAEQGFMFVAPDYTMAPDADGSLYPMTEQVRQAIVWTYRNAAKYGGDPDRIFLSGHSAGAHLGGILITTDWSAYGLPDDVIRGAFLSSGMYDLYPVSLSSRNEYVAFTNEMIQDLSPVNHIEHITMPVILLYGTEESPEFQRQTREFAVLLEENGVDVALYVLKGYNHFEIMVASGNPYDLPARLMLQQMGVK